MAALLDARRQFRRPVDPRGKERTMFRESITRSVKVLLIAGFLVSAPAAAGPSESSGLPDALAAGSFWAQSWSWLQSLWSEDAALACGGDLKAGDVHLAGRALVKQGIYTNYWGYPREALGLLKRGIALLDRERDPQLMVSATESILEVMEQCGEHKAASALLLKSGLRQALAGQPLSLIKLRCVEGRIFAGLGKTRRAEAAFLEARAGFREHQQEYNAALVGLDLAGIWLQQGKTAKVTELAEDMLATFRRLGIQREGLRAMEYLTLASQKKRLTPGLVGHISGFLRKLEREPQLRFEAL